jgi:parvulin-like peptidyl-prolyl isomerase
VARTPPWIFLLAILPIAAAPVAAQAPDGFAPPTVPSAVRPLPAGYGPRIDMPVAPSGPASFSNPAPPADDAPARPAAPPHKAKPFKGGQIVARIGGQVVLAAEVMEGVHETLEANKNRIPPSQLETARLLLMKRNLDKLIDTKLLFAAAKRVIPEENFPKVEEQLAKHFEEDRLPQLMKMTKSHSVAELEEKLEEFGSSLAQQKRKFGERALAQQWLQQNVRHEEEVGHAEMLAYYRDHIADYKFEATARWEELAVRFDKFSSKAEAYRALAAMGNEVFQGADFAEVAKARSQGVTADEGGQYDWTTRGGLVSEELNKALFTLPVGQLSPIIETRTGFHIVRVLERRAAGRTSFVEAQVEIKKQIEQERKQKRIDEYMAQLREETRVWTMFDDMPELTELSRRAQRAPR